jgi:hypothetical protein
MSTVDGGWTGPKIVKEGLVLYLDAGSPNSFYNKTSTTIKDISGNNRTGTLTNGTTYDTGNGGSVFFDGSDDLIDLGSNPFGSINNYTELSFTFWFRALSITNLGNIFSWGDNSGVRCRLSSSQIQLLERGGLNSLLSLTISLNTWINVTITLSTTDGLKIYINGTLNSSSISNFAPNMVSGAFVLGRRGTALAEPYYGHIANFCVYGKALSTLEVLQNFNATKSRFGL